MKILANNKRAKFEYHIIEDFEAGLVLKGTEVKSLRFNTGNIQSSYIIEKNRELWMIEANIPKYKMATNIEQHDAKRMRKLLLHKREMQKLMTKIKTQGTTLIPLMMYFNDRNKIKLKIALAKGKNLRDKRATIKERDLKREAQKEFKI
ncbi:MAG: SsrA-binding protein SmpB [Anaplasmataceae bacterium]|nr:SsrA-binding protein SmpB [Anaplasmataceae bacterium]